MDRFGNLIVIGKEWPPAHEVDQEAEEGKEGELVQDRMSGLDSLLGCEGAGSTAYFQAFRHLIRCNWQHNSRKRVRRPPTDPVNAMLSYGYVLLTTQVASALVSVGFDPYIGYLHASRYGAVLQKEG